MSYLPARPTNGLGLSRTDRQFNRELERVRSETLIGAARIQATAFKAQVGLHEVAGLTGLEAELIKQHPLGEARFQALVDTATAAIAKEIAYQPWRW